MYVLVNGATPQARVSIAYAHLPVCLTHGQCDAKPTVTFPACAGIKFILLGDINPIAYAPEFTWPNSSNKLLAIRPAVISEQFSPTFQREKTIRHTCKPVILHLAGIKSLLQHCGRTTAFFKSGGNMPEAKELLNRRVMNGVSDNSVLISLTSHIGAGSNRQVLHNAEPIRFSALSIDTGVHFSNVNTNLCGTSYIREAEVDERTDSYTSNVTTATQHCCKTW